MKDLRSLTEDVLINDSYISKDILKHLPFGAYLIDNKGHIIYYNPAMEKMSGSKMSKVVGLNVFKIPNYKKVGLDKHFKQAMKGKSFRTDAVKYTSYIGKKTGYRHYNGIPLKDAQGKVSQVLCVVEDVTEKIKANNELQNQKDFLYNVIDNIPNTLFVKEAKDLKFVYFNKAGLKLMGVDKKNIIGKNDYDFFPKKQADFFTKKDRKVLKEKTLLDIPKEEIETKKGRRILHTKKIPIYDNNGKPNYLLGISEDITAQKKTEEYLKLYMKGFESSPNSMVLVEYKNKKPTIINVNNAFTDYYGYKKEEVIRKGPNILSSGQKDKKYYQKMWKNILNPKIGYWTDEIKNKCKDGSYLDVILSVYTIFDDKKNPQYFVANHIDISQRKKMEEMLIKAHNELDERVKQKTKALVEEESRLEALLYSLGEGVIALTPEGYILSINPMAQRLISPEGFHKKGGDISKYTFVDKENKKININEIIKKEIVKQKKTISIKSFFIDDLEKKTPLQITFSPIVNKNRTFGVAITLRDITKESEIENAKSEFVSLASHQLRTPLSGIKWLIQAALMNDATMTDHQKDFLKSALESNERMITLINDFLNLSRLEANIVKVKPVETNMNTFLLTLIKESRYVAKEKKQVIIFRKYKKDIKAKIDKVLVSEILNTIVSNAIRYSPQNSKIVISLNLDKEKIIIKIKDSGIGIAAKDKEKIFTRFYRSTEASKIDSTGSGLGLYIASKIIKIVKGKINLESKQGKGTTFIITLPKTFKPKKGQKSIISDNKKI